MVDDSYLVLCLGMTLCEPAPCDTILMDATQCFVANARCGMVSVFWQNRKRILCGRGGQTAACDELLYGPRQTSVRPAKASSK